jgi:hypothetical protein
MSNYVTLVNLLLTRLNEVTLDTGGDGFTSVRGVQSLAKAAVNNSINEILQKGQEWPFLKTTYTQTLTAGTGTYDFPADYSTADYETFYLKQLASKENNPAHLPAITYEQYVKNYRSMDELGDSGSGISAPEYVYQTYDEKFGLTPVPDAAYEVEYVYWKFPSDLNLYNDECVIPARFNHTIIDGAMYYMMVFRSNEQGAAINQQKFQEGIRQMERVLIDEPIRVTSTMIQGKTNAG